MKAGSLELTAQHQALPACMARLVRNLVFSLFLLGSSADLCCFQHPCLRVTQQCFLHIHTLVGVWGATECGQLQGLPGGFFWVAHSLLNELPCSISPHSYHSLKTFCFKNISLQSGSFFNLRGNCYTTQIHRRVDLIFLCLFLSVAAGCIFPAHRNCLCVSLCLWALPGSAVVLPKPLSTFTLRPTSYRYFNRM